MIKFIEFFQETHLDSVVLMGSDEGYGLRKLDAAEYIDGVCHDAAVISGLSIGYGYCVAGNGYNAGRVRPGKEK